MALPVNYKNMKVRCLDVDPHKAINRLDGKTVLVTNDSVGS